MPACLRTPPAPSVGLAAGQGAGGRGHARIQAGDRLKFYLPDDCKAAINNIYTVAADGTIEFPGEGRVQVAGKTLDEARQALRGALQVSYAVQTMELTLYAYNMVRVKDDEVVKVKSPLPLREGLTVKEALRGAPPLAGKTIWIVRPGGGNSSSNQVLAVDWSRVSKGRERPQQLPAAAGRLLVCRGEIRFRPATDTRPFPCPYWQPDHRLKPAS